MNVTPEMLSRYADGQVSHEEALTVERTVKEDLAARAELADFALISELFGHVEPEEVSDELKERLYQIRPVARLEGFKALKTAPSRRRSWVSWAAAAAAVVLVAVGATQLMHRPELVLTDFTRMALDESGRTIDTRHLNSVTMRSGDSVRAAAREKVSYRAPDGSVVVILPGGGLELGDPREEELFELERGTVLCSVLDRDRTRVVRAAGYTIRVERADFGVRLDGAETRAAGAFGGDPAEITVAVSRGELEVSQNGSREKVEASWRLVLRRGKPVRRSRAYGDPIYRDLMRRLGHEILPGYFERESGVNPIRARAWRRQADGRSVLVLSDRYAVARYLVFQLSRPGAAVDVTRLRPYADADGLAEASTVRAQVASGGVAWIDVAAFDGGDARISKRKIATTRSSLIRIELSRVDADRKLNVKASLWADRPPVDMSEEVR